MTESEISDTPSCEALSYGVFISDLSASVPLLRTLDSVNSDDIFNIDTPTLLSEFALLLSTLRVPGPSDLFPDKGLLGSGAHFTVFKQEIPAFGNSQYARAALQNNIIMLAVKQPNFMLDSQQKLDLSEPKFFRQVRSMILEITALCHPRLRGHPNVVNLLGWGISTLNWHKVPFIGLELANTDLSSFLRNWTDVSLAVKHYISLDIACAVDAIHEVGLVHGDLKPENVLMFHESDHWVAKLADFGGAANVGKDGVWEGRGTVGWRAPELRMLFEYGTRLDRSVLDRIDVYSYGLMLWSIFLKEGGVVPHDENDDKAEYIALMDLQNSCPNLPASLRITLKDAFTSLLNPNPHFRRHKVTGLLNDRNKACYDRTEERNLELYKPESGQANQKEEADRFEWEVPEISNQITSGLKSSFLKHQHLSPTILYALIMKFLSYGPDLDLNIDDRALLLDLLCTSTQQNDNPSKSVIYRIYEYFNIPTPPEIRGKKGLWMADAISDGAYFLRAELKQMDNELCMKSIGFFRESGGYNRFYAAISPMSLSDVAQYSLNDEFANPHMTKSLNSRGDNILHILASYDRAEALSELLNRMGPENVNTLNAHGETPLYRACMAGLTNNVLQLLSYGADSSLKPSADGPGCLHWLFHFDPCDVNLVADKIVKHGASIHEQSKQKIPMLYYPFVLPMGTALHWAVEMSVPEAVTALLRNGANPSFRDGSDPYEYDDNVRHLNMVLPPDGTVFSVAERPTMGMNSFDLAVKNRDYRILEILLSRMSNAIAGQTDEEGYTALHRLDAGHWLHTKGGTSIWKPFLQGSTVDQKEALKRTVAILFESGFCLDSLTRPQESAEDGPIFSRKTTLMLAIRSRCADTVQVLIEAGADVDIVDDEGGTALFAFSYLSADDPIFQSKTIALLLSANPSIHVRDVYGDSPLVVAARLGLTEVASGLLQYGADICDREMCAHSGRYGWTVLALSSNCRIDKAHEHDEWMCMILTRYAIPSLRNGDDGIRDKILNKAGLNGGTLLHFTAQNGLLRCCEMLLKEASVEINPICKGRFIRRPGLVTHYRTPLDEALEASKMQRRWLEQDFSKKDVARFLGVYDEIAKLLRTYGGVKANTLVTDEYSPTIPPTFDLKYPNNAL